ncbi:unnamed protein product [Cyprideis torosa]|uniref:Uncharacterized protein n=1 Tax=Cyprideis torosa TaxID=163714 RepID=A0A7R8WLY6_9CRUS|nr:unnamed protein product [Cyprideis torosa]CAG0904768.1 unnamed protein product [Cyprideis torosa]
MMIKEEIGLGSSHEELEREEKEPPSLAGWLGSSSPRATFFILNRFNCQSRVSEVGLPNNVVDVWEATGASDVFRYTWDSMRNSNIGMRGPRLRFDRMYLKSNSNASPLLQPLMFGLVGIVKVRETQSFPSDHWGIRALFQVNE